MEGLIFLFSFFAVVFGALAVRQALLNRRRARSVLQDREALQQRATVVRALGLVERWELAAKQAGLNWTVRTFMAIAGFAIFMGALFFLAGFAELGLMVAVGGCAVPWLVVRRQQRVRAEQFSAQLPPALTLAANTIRAGGTLLQAVRAVARQMPDPIGGEFGRIEQALQLQVPLGLALDQARQRIGAHEFAAVVVACKVAGQAGADLDVVLENISREIVEEREFAQAMRAASSEGRWAAIIITALPFLAGAYFSIASPGYFDPLLSTPFGWMLVIGSIGSIAIGWVVIKRITDVRTW